MREIRLHGIMPEVWGDDLCFQRGQSYLLKAASGRGKSSLCSYIYGLRKDFSGKIYFDGRDTSSLSSSEWDVIRQTSIGVMFQDLRLFNELSPVENVMIKANLSGCYGPAEVEDMLVELGLKDKLACPVGLLSFGQQQRVAFVRMLCQSADFWILDEPVSHLDSENAHIMARMLSSHSERSGAGIIVTTIGHDLPYKYDNTLML